MNTRIFILFIALISLAASINAQETESTRILKARNSEFMPEIIQLNENVYVAVGYDGSNTSMVIGENGVVIIDALRAQGAAETVAKEFRKITDKPVKALIYTHGHLDHTGGTSAFVGNSKDVKIIAREGFKEELQENSPVEPILKKRNARQFGRDLPDYLLPTEYEKTKVIKMKIKLLRALAAHQINAPARNYYLSCAYELENKYMTK